MTVLSLLLPLMIAQAVPSAPGSASDQCWKSENHGGTPVRVYQGDRQCVDLAPPREMTGVWVNDFEGSAFYENAQTVADTRGKKGDIWLTIDDQTRMPPDFRRQYGHAYRMTIIARSARDMNRPPLEGYGHMGISRGLIVTDRIVSMQDLGPARPR